MTNEEINLQLAAAVAEKQLTESAVNNIQTWLTESRYAEYRDQVAQHIADANWDVLDDVFWTIIPFGTGGRRGKMYPIGSNAINDRTIGESAAGLAQYVSKHAPDSSNLSCAIAYDTRHKSIEFSRLCAEIMVAHGFKVFYLDEHRSTPELSFLVRYKNCSCGIMVTASHNPPSDNAVKCYWSTGGQILPPHDQGVIDCVMSVDQIQRVSFEGALADGRIELCREEVDNAFIEQLKAQQYSGSRDLNLLYSPLHGVGSTAVVPALAADGFKNVEVYGPHAEPNGDFPNVPGHVSNPENAAVFDAPIEHAKANGHDAILATDPDCDRLGVAAPLTSDTSGEWRVLNGNQIGALLTDYVLSKRKEQGSLTAEQYLVKTLVTTEMVRRIGDSYGVTTYGNLLVGFKWIGGLIDEKGPDNFVLGTEESHGYLVGQYARDKDGAVAAMLFSELAAEVKATGKSLCEKLDDLYWQHGYHAEKLVTQKMPGSEGMAEMERLMSAFRTAPPTELAGIKVSAVRNYANNTTRLADGSTQPLDGPTGNMVMIDLELAGNYVAVRPSGTEPKVKYYIFTFVPAEQLANLDDARAEMAERISHLERDLTSFAK